MRKIFKGKWLGGNKAGTLRRPHSDPWKLGAIPHALRRPAHQMRIKIIYKFLGAIVTIPCLIISFSKLCALSHHPISLSFRFHHPDLPQNLFYTFLRFENYNCTIPFMSQPPNNVHTTSINLFHLFQSKSFSGPCDFLQ